MSNIIEELFYGNLEPQELTTELTPKLKKKLSELVKKEDELTSNLSEEEKELFTNYVSAYNEFSSISICDGFVSGYIMSNIIEDFYYGNIEPQEVNSELTPKLKKKLNNLAEKEEQLTARLNGEDKELFQSYVSAYIEFSTTSNADSFISGFRLGAKFTYDTFVKNAKG